jgi:hypothetical protein
MGFYPLVVMVLHKKAREVRALKELRWPVLISGLRPSRLVVADTVGISEGPL